MNVALTPKAVVHLSSAVAIVPTCNPGSTSDYAITDRPVTCKRCLKIVADREAAADRVAYLAGLADEQDMDYSQAQVTTAEQTPEADPSSTVQFEVKDERCCEHTAMYHGARGCDTCRCNTPRNVMPQAGTVRVGRNVDTDAGRVPFTARLVIAINLSWIPSVRPAAVITATNGEDTVWVYVQTECAKAKMLYVGRDLADAFKAQDAYVIQHTNYVAMLAKESYGYIPTPTRATQTIYGPIPKPAEMPAYETDPRTGLPVVKIFDVRYVIGILQSSRFDSDFVEFWAADATGPHFSAVHRASATSHAGSIGAHVWDAHRWIRNV